MENTDPVKALQRFFGVFLFRDDQTVGANRLISTTYPDGKSTSTSYDSLGHVVGTTNQNFKSTNYFFDAAGRSVSVQYPDNRFVTYGYDNEGHMLSKTTIASDGGGSQTAYTHYDLLGRADAVTNTDGFSFTRTVYDGQGRVIDTIDELGNDTHTDYDQAGRSQDVIAGSGLQTTNYTYDNNGNVLTVSVAGVNQSTTSYDSLNRAATVTYQQPLNEPAIQPVITTYDADSRKLSQTDKAGKLTQYGYDGQGHLTGVTLVSSSGNQTEAYTYDNLGNMLSQTDANGHKTTFTYDNMNRRTSRTLPDGIATETYDQYDNVGNLVHKTTFKGQSISYSYDQNTDKLTGETFAEGSIIFSYDGFLRRQSMQDVSGSTTYNYDQRNRLVTKSSPFGILTYGYDNHSNLISVASSNTNGTTVTYQYDPLNRPVTITDYHASVRQTQTGTNLITTYSYDPIGNLAAVQKPNGEVMTYGYDILNRLTSMAVTVGGNAIASYFYTLGAGGNRTSVNEVSGRAVSWNYDDLYRLTGEIISNDPVVANIGAISYQYDPVGNRTNRTSGIAAVPSQPSLSYDADDQLIGGGYTYDANGSTTTDPNGTYVYDSLGRMTSATVNGVTSTYVYDGDDNKVRETIGGVSTTNYLVETNNLTGYTQVLEETNGSGTVNRVYTYGTSRISQDQLVSSNWTLSFFGTDGQGSVRYLTDINGTITDRMDYDSFGILVNHTGPTSNEIFYQGEQLDGNTNFYNLRARWMNPSIGRFQMMDKFEGDKFDLLSLQKYVFTKDNPINGTDPSGHDDGGMSSGPRVLWPGPTGMWGYGGPDITNALNATLKNIADLFGPSPIESKIEAGQIMTDVTTAEFSLGNYGAAGAWDIYDLKDVGNGPRTVDHRNTIRGVTCGDFPWQYTVGFNNRCYYAGQANYAEYGEINKLMYDFLLTQGPIDGLSASEFSLSAAIQNVASFKSKNYDAPPIYLNEALDFTRYGFDREKPTNFLPCIPKGTIGDQMLDWAWKPIKPYHSNPDIYEQ